MKTVNSIPLWQDKNTGDVKVVQQALLDKGYDPNGIDDSYGKGMRKAIIAFQKDNGIDSGGFIDLKTLSLLGIRFHPVIRSDGYSSLSWEYHHPERSSWTDHAIRYIESVWPKLKKATDITVIRPDYNNLNKKQQINIWAELISAIALPESSWKLNSWMVETTQGNDVITGKPVRSEGLLQLSYQDKRSYPHLPCRFDWHKDKNLGENDITKTIFQPDVNLEMGINILAHQIERKGKILLESGVYWAVMKIGGKFQKIKQITTMVQNLSFS